MSLRRQTERIAILGVVSALRAAGPMPDAAELAACVWRCCGVGVTTDEVREAMESSNPTGVNQYSGGGTTGKQDRDAAKAAYEKSLGRAGGGMWRNAEDAAYYGKLAGHSPDKVVKDLWDKGYSDKEVVGFMKSHGHGQLPAESAISRLGSKEYQDSLKEK